jgi:hypothetical protein
MRLFTVIFVLCISTLAVSSDLIDSTTVYIQSLSSTTRPVPLAEIKFNPSTLSAELVSFETPDLEIESKLLRVGVYDTATSSWKSSTSVTSVETFAKGFSPTLILSLDAQGEVIGVSCKSGKIDAGQTRDFGPKVKVLKMAKGKLPELNRPVVLSPEGKLAEPEPERTMLQKYWWGKQYSIPFLIPLLTFQSYTHWSHVTFNDRRPRMNIDSVFSVFEPHEIPKSFVMLVECVRKRHCFLPGITTKPLIS